MLKAAIIGFGKIGRLRAGLAEAHPNLVVDSVCETQAVECPYPVFSHYEQVLDRMPEVVFVCTSNDSIAEIARAALERGIHVFSEKPPGRTVEECRRMISAEKSRPGLKLKFGFNHRYHASVEEALRLVRSGRFGRILSARGVYGKSGGPDFETQWRNQRKISGGGILLDQGIHMLDLILLFCGGFSEVYSFVDTLHWDIDVEDNVFAIMRSDRGQSALLVSSAIMWKHMFSLDLVLEDGYLSLTGILSNSRSYGRESLAIARKSFEPGRIGQPDEQTFFFDDDLSWEREVDEFVKAVLLDHPIQIGTSADALRVMELIERIYAADPIWAPSEVGARS